MNHFHVLTCTFITTVVSGSFHVMMQLYMSLDLPNWIYQLNRVVNCVLKIVLQAKSNETVPTHQVCRNSQCNLWKVCFITQNDLGNV